MAERAVFIGGFGNGKTSAEHVAEVLGSELNYDDVDAFTFSRAMKDRRIIRRASQGVDLWTHSAGLLAAIDTAPRHIDALNAPLPTSRLRLLGKTGVKIARMHFRGIGIQSLEDIGSVARYNASTTAELIRHPLANLGQLKQISQFDAVSAAVAARHAGIPVDLGYTEGDEYFQLAFHREIEAEQHGVRILRTKGIHDELVIRPAAFLESYLQKKQQRAQPPRSFKTGETSKPF